MPNVPVTINIASLPTNFCFTGTPNDIAQSILGLLSAYVKDFEGVVVSKSRPDSSQNGNVWVKVNTDGTLIGIATYGNGQWVTPYRIPPSAKEAMIWLGSLAELYSYDGGDGTDPTTLAGTPTPTSGSFWKASDALAFRVPMGAGTNGTTYDGHAATIINPGDTLGEERHVLTMDEIFHAHAIGKIQFVTGVTGFRQLTLETGTVAMGANVAGNISEPWQGDPGASGTIAEGPTSNVAGVSGTGIVTDIPVTSNQTNPVVAADGSAPTSHQNLPPVLGVVYCVRTARQYYVLG